MEILGGTSEKAIEGHSFVLMRAFVQFNYELYTDYDVLPHIEQEVLCTAAQRRQNISQSKLFSL